MAIKDMTIIHHSNPILRKHSLAVTAGNIESEKIKKIINEMKEVLATQKDGVAIAAPQIGELLRIFVVSDVVMKEADAEYKSIGRDLVFINPRITRVSRQKNETEEGCLSIRWKYGFVKRAMKITITGYDESGKKVERGASGLLAQIFQHEIDHLNGILFTDKAFNVRDMPPKEIDGKK